MTTTLSAASSALSCRAPATAFSKRAPPPRLRAIATHQEKPVDLLLTDVVLPGVNGDQLGDYLSFLFPKITVVYMSGYGSAASFGSVGSQVGAHMLPKPFSKRTLLLAVAQLLHWKEHDTQKFVPTRAWGGFSNSALSLV